ncbi:hypothetical protein [Flavobacterium sp.]|uniref:hypothetical protein n=1 Tax=Flavobacterium sp. TaxID=239 RepID=UPI0035B2F621
MKRSQLILILFTILRFTTSFAQTTKITQLLQVTLQQENKVRKMIQVEIDSLGNEIGLMKQDLDSLEVTELVVKNDTLYYTTKQKMLYQEGYYLEQQVVALKDITAVSKDIGLFLETAYDKLKIISNQYYSNGEVQKTIRYNNLFRTYFVSLRDIEYLAYDLIKAFKNAGYTIEKGSWYD